MSLLPFPTSCARRAKPWWPGDPGHRGHGDLGKQSTHFFGQGGKCAVDVGVTQGHERHPLPLGQPRCEGCRRRAVRRHPGVPATRGAIGGHVEGKPVDPELGKDLADDRLGPTDSVGRGRGGGHPVSPFEGGDGQPCHQAGVTRADAHPDELALVGTGGVCGHGRIMLPAEPCRPWTWARAVATKRSAGPGSAPRWRWR